MSSFLQGIHDDRTEIASNGKSREDNRSVLKDFIGSYDTIERLWRVLKSGLKPIPQQTRTLSEWTLSEELGSCDYLSSG